MKLSVSTAIALVLAVSTQAGLAIPASASATSEQGVTQAQSATTRDQIDGATRTNGRICFFKNICC